VFFPVETRASGRFPVRVVLSSRDGAVQAGPPVTITVNSTVFGAFGSWLTYGALAFLALWWGRHIWTTRRAGGSRRAEQHRAGGSRRAEQHRAGGSRRAERDRAGGSRRAEQDRAERDSGRAPA
jgi:hypothetical protein